MWLDAVGMEFTAVRLNGNEVPYGYNGRKMVVVAPLAEGHHQLMLAYRAYPRQTVYFIGWEEGSNGDAQIWTQGQGKYSSHWVPSFDDMREKVAFAIDIDFDPGYSVIANGTLTSVTRSDSLLHWQFDMKNPMSSYLLAFAVGRFDSLALESASGIPLYLHYPPEARDKASFTYRYSRQLFDFLEREIGLPYPWEVYRQVPVRDFMYAGMENTAATFFDDTYLVDSLGYNDRNYVNVNAHELAHQWFGNLVTETDGGQHWLHEGLATFYAYLAEEAIFGPGYLDWKLLETARVLTVLDREGQGAALLNPQAGSLIFYEKGAWALFLLRHQVGDKVFRKGIRNYLETFAFGNATVSDFLAVMEGAGAPSLSEFSSRWLESDTFPEKDALAFLSERSEMMAGFLALSDQTLAPDSLSAQQLTAAWEVSGDAGYRAALLRDFRPSFRKEHLEKAFEDTLPEVQKANLAGLENTEPWMVPYLEALLDAPSYEVREAALFRLWSAVPESRAGYLRRTEGNGSLASLKFRQAWWVLALFTENYVSLQQRAGFLEALRETTAPSFNREVRENGFALLRQIDALGDQNLRDLIGATEHHSWQFRNFARRLLDELIEDRPERSFWELLGSDFAETSFPYFYSKLNAL